MNKPDLTSVNAHEIFHDWPERYTARLISFNNQLIILDLDVRCSEISYVICFKQLFEDYIGRAISQPLFQIIEEVPLKYFASLRINK